MSNPGTLQESSPSMDAKAQASKKRSRSRSESPTQGERPLKKTTTTTKPREKQPVKFLIISDTHDNDDNDDDDDKSSFNPPTTPVDVVLHCGDLTENGSLASLGKAITKLASIPAELHLMIAGNHETTLDERYYLSEGGSPATHAAALQLVTSTAAQQGVTYLPEGTHTFTLQSGATFTIYASPWTPQYGQSAFQYPSAHDRFNPSTTTPAWATNVATPSSTVLEGVDIVMTHGPPKYLLDDTGAMGAGGGCEHLRRAVCRVRPRLCCFGHVHGGYGAQRVYFEDGAGDGGGDGGDDDDGMVCLPREFVGKNQARRKGYAELSPGSREAMREGGQTLMVNAAVMDGEGRATNAPWMVELEL
ncbi:putative rhamnogalacturonate lyase C [Diplodia seriata]|uniref:Putative rhamnogalacturonate lyase C n=1 Tax=Diplodia seriata TaxID=420778 RepID=A0A1S8B5T2_9PEZI|nr:putative rhamnogalacturonate lyase C [Diplodia seriata]